MPPPAAGGAAQDGDSAWLQGQAGGPHREPGVPLLSPQLPNITPRLADKLVCSQMVSTQLAEEPFVACLALQGSSPGQEPLPPSPQGPCLCAQAASSLIPPVAKDAAWSRWFKVNFKSDVRESQQWPEAFVAASSSGWCATCCQTGEVGAARAGTARWGSQVCGMGWGGQVPPQGCPGGSPSSRLRISGRGSQLTYSTRSCCPLVSGANPSPWV